MINRRQLLKVGAASLVVMGAGLGGFGITRTPTRALEPWQDGAHQYADPRLKALSYAILAPNPHNRQPWLAELIGDDEVFLTCDLGRRLPETDPFDRQITIGLGCFLELFRIAAAQDRYGVQMRYFPDGEPGLRLDSRVVASIKLEKLTGLPRDPLFAFIKSRRSNKELYDTSRPIARNGLDAVLGDDNWPVLVGGTVMPTEIEVLRDLSWRAHEIEALTPRTMQESIDLMRIGKDEINSNPDGIDLGGFSMEMLAGLGFIDRTQMADPASTAFSQGMGIYYGLMHSAMGHVWVITPDNSRRSQLEAGRVWLRMNLRATANGIAIHPISQALQEYAEMAAIYNEIHAELAVETPARIQMFARIGYGPETGPSPRWPMKNSLV